jgi:anaerobic selenocysteine-containing dehydrogenase
VRRRIGDASVFLSKEETERRGLSEGENVVLMNDAGSLHLKVRISPNVPDRVALVYKGSWPSHCGGTANVNVLNAGLRSDIAESTAVHGVEATLAKA